MTATAARPRIAPSSPVACPVCKRPAGLCCLNERGAVRKAGQHRERLELEKAGVMTDEELLESIDRHFMAGCGFLDATQLRSHEKAGICPECSARALMAAGVRVAAKGSQP